jgi:hypothetical protein
MGRLQNRVAIITGAGQRNGLAYAPRLHIIVNNAALYDDFDTMPA